MPFGAGSPLALSASGAFAGFTAVNFVGFRVCIGLRLRVRALRSSWLSELSSSSSSSTRCGVLGRFLAADRVTGPKYESCEPPSAAAAASLSDGVGLGEMTRGVPGTACLVRRTDMADENGGRLGRQIAPMNARRRSKKGRRAACRCWSFREERAARLERGDARARNAASWNCKKAEAGTNGSSVKVQLEVAESRSTTFP